MHRLPHLRGQESRLFFVLLHQGQEGFDLSLQRVIVA